MVTVLLATVARLDQALRAWCGICPPRSYVPMGVGNRSARGQSRRSPEQFEPLVVPSPHWPEAFSPKRPTSAVGLDRHGFAVTSAHLVLVPICSGDERDPPLQSGPVVVPFAQLPESVEVPPPPRVPPCQATTHRGDPVLTNPAATCVPWQQRCW